MYIENKSEIPLDKLNKPFDFSIHENGVNIFEMELPVSKQKVTYSLLTHREEKLIEKELKALGKVNKNEFLRSNNTT